MAASTVEKGGVRKSPGLRTSLINPHTLTWPTVEKKTYHYIMNAIGRQFPSVLSQKTISKRKKIELLSGPVTEEDRVLMKQIEEKNILRKCLVAGINEVTKGLEKDQLALVLVDKSVMPTMMTNHLMLLGATRQTPTLGLHDLSQLIGPLLHYKKVTALGFKKERPSPCFDALINVITDKVPEIVIPWLKPFVESNMETNTDSEQDENTTAQNKTTEKKNVKTEGLKRKLQDELETEDTDFSPATKSIKIDIQKTETADEEQTEKECNETEKQHSSEMTDTISKSSKQKKKKLNIERTENQDFEITTVSYQPPNIKTVEKGHKEKKSKKKKKKQKK